MRWLRQRASSGAILRQAVGAMAIIRLHAQVISWSQGRKAGMASTYRAAERLIDARTGRVHNAALPGVPGCVYNFIALNVQQLAYILSAIRMRWVG